MLIRLCCILYSVWWEAIKLFWIWNLEFLRHSTRSSTVTDACLNVTSRHQVISSHWCLSQCYVTVPGHQQSLISPYRYVTALGHRRNVTSLYVLVPGHQQSLMLASLLRHSTRSSAVIGAYLMLRHSTRSSAVTDACLIVTPQHQVISSHWFHPIVTSQH